MAWEDDAVVSSVESKVDTVDTVVDGIQTDLDNATDGLSALKSLIDTVDALVSPAEIIATIFDIDMGYWTEVDVPGRVTIDYTNERIAVSDLDRDEDVYVYKATAANVTDFILDFEFRVLNTTVVNSRCAIGISDTVGTVGDVDNGLYVRLRFVGANDTQLNIVHATSGSMLISGAIESLADDTTYYARLLRRGSYCWLGVYSDRIRETHVTGSPVEYKDVTPVAFTHLYPISGYDDGNPSFAFDAYVEAIKLISAPDIDKYFGRHVL